MQRAVQIKRHCRRFRCNSATRLRACMSVGYSYVGQNVFNMHIFIPVYKWSSLFEGRKILRSCVREARDFAIK